MAARRPRSVVKPDPLKARNLEAVHGVLVEWRRVAPLNEALAEVALTLARALDAGAGMAVAAVAKELRATLAELEPRTNDDADDPAAVWLDRLLAPVGDASSP